MMGVRAVILATINSLTLARIYKSNIGP